MYPSSHGHSLPGNSPRGCVQRLTGEGGGGGGTAYSKLPRPGSRVVWGMLPRKILDSIFEVVHFDAI